MFNKPKIAMSVILLTLNKNYIDLDTLARKTLNSHYLKNRFAACIVRDKGKGVALYFGSGTIVISFDDLSKRDELTALYIKKLSIVDSELKVFSSKIVNTTLTASLKHCKVYLNKLHKSVGSKRKVDEIKFEAELFPGLSRKIVVNDNTTIKIIVFCSGKFNITGCKNIEEMHKAYKIAVNWIKKFVKK
jgi:TATA-box binding protein (TBP) (component of TFIID and TFIIIB)